MNRFEVERLVKSQLSANEPKSAIRLCDTIANPDVSVVDVKFALLDLRNAGLALISHGTGVALYYLAPNPPSDSLR
jgi:hypothetical protein